MKDKKIVEEIKQLEDVIAMWSNAYYAGNPIVSDAVFDATLERLKTLEPNHPLITKVGHGYIPVDSRLKKYHHTRTRGSLTKMKLVECQSDKPWNKGKQFICTPKFDGGSIVAYYDEIGRLIRVLSRGDGEEGFDITHNVKHLVPDHVPVQSGIISVRGEVLMSYEDAEILGASHPRNKAVGVSQSLNSTTEDELSKLTAVWYSADFEDNTGTTQTKVLDYLTSLGFLTPDYVRFREWSEFLNFARIYEKNDSTTKTYFGHDETKTYPIDGLVLNLIDDPDEAIAIKFENEEVETIVKNIDWELSRTGRMVPVLEVDPVSVSGATVSRVTANNHQWLSSRKAGIGSKIKIVRSNEVIPMLTNVVEESTDYGNITHCPSCGEELDTKGVDLVCINEACPKKEESVVEMVLNHFAVDGIGPNVIDRLMSNENILTIMDLECYRSWFLQAYKENQFIHNWYQNEVGLGPETAKKVVETLWKAFTSRIKVGDIFRFANIPGVGKTFSKCVDSSFWSGKEADFVENVCDKNEKFDIENFRNCFVNYLQPIAIASHRERIVKVINVFRDQMILTVTNEELKMETENSKNETFKFCLAGKLSKKRDDVVKEFEGFGHAFVSESSCDILIADAPSSSSKYQKAVKRQIPIMTEQEFRDLYC